MNATLVLYTLRQRLLQPARVLVLIALFGFPLLFTLMARSAGIELLNAGAGFAMVLGAGLLGSDVSAGVLQLLFVRPVTRTEYVFSRWGAVALGAVTLTVMQVAAGALILQATGYPAPLGVVARHALEQSVVAVTVVSGMTMLSSQLPGIGDLDALLCGQVGSMVLMAVGGFTRQALLERTGRELNGVFSPQFSWAIAFGGASPSWFHLASILSTIALSLAVAVVVMNRRELSYANA